LIELQAVSADELAGANRAEIENLWRRVFPDTAEERFEEILPRHAQRAAFRFLAARTEDGQLVGFAYGYEGRPGEWWHDSVAAALAPEQQVMWLAPGHFEFVELQVAPRARRSGDRRPAP
jgi:hypothetical protein